MVTTPYPVVVVNWHSCLRRLLVEKSSLPRNPSVFCLQAMTRCLARNSPLSDIETATSQSSGYLVSCNTTRPEESLSYSDSLPDHSRTLSLSIRKSSYCLRWHFKIPSHPIIRSAPSHNPDTAKSPDLLAYYLILLAPFRFINQIILTCALTAPPVHTSIHSLVLLCFLEQQFSRAQVFHSLNTLDYNADGGNV